MEYFVLLGGQKYGPADQTVLNQWIAEGRIVPDTMLEEAASGRAVRAADLPGLQFPQQHFQQPQQPGGQTQGYAPGPSMQQTVQPGGMYGGSYGQGPQSGSPYLRGPQMAPVDPGLQGRTTLALILSIIAFLCSCPLGIVALIFGIMCKSAYNRGDYVGAEKQAKATIILSIVLILVGLAYAVAKFATISQALSHAR